MLDMMSVCHSFLPLFFTAVFCVIDIWFFLIEMHALMHIDLLIKQ